MGFLRMLFEIFFAYRKAKKNLETATRLRMTEDPMTRAYRSGQYEQALALAMDPFLRAEMLIQLGRSSEGEQALRQIAQTEQNPKALALIQSQIGQVLLRQQRYDEAMECFQTAIRHWPERGSGYRNLAEWYLRRGDNPAEALRMARLAIEKEKAGPGLSEDSKALNLAEQSSVLAWAISVNSHDGAEVDRLCQGVAFPAIAPVSSLAMSGVFFGKAWAILGDIRQSAAQFEHAARIDPNGVWGREAASMAVAAQK